MVITMDMLRLAHAITHGACKPPGPIISKDLRLAFVWAGIAAPHGCSKGVV